MKFTTAADVGAYLPAGGTADALSADLIDPTSSSSGVFGGQVLALAINVALSNAGLTTTGLGDLALCSLVEGSTIREWTLSADQASALNGKTVGQVLADANTALGGGGLPAYVASFSDLNQLVTALNESFDNCVAGAFATAHLCN